MNIGIDIDGVLVDLERYVIDYGTKMCVEKKWPINLKLNEYFEGKKFSWSEDQEEEFWNTYLEDYVLNTKPREFAKEVIDKLKKENNKIYIITARNEEGLPPESYGKMQEFTKKWLLDNEIEYDKLIFASDLEKLEQCTKNNIDIMIEDSPNNILNISKKIKVIKYDCKYNKNIEGDNIITAYSWYHIYNIIKETKKE